MRPAGAYQRIADRHGSVRTAQRSRWDLEPWDEAETGRRPDAVPPARAGLPRRADCRPGPGGGSGTPRRFGSLAAREGVTIFLNTHNLAEAEKLCQRMGVINKGKLLAVGTLDELRAQNGSPRVEVTGTGFSETIIAQLRGRPDVRDVVVEDGKLSIELTPGSSTAPLVRLLVASNAEVEEVHKSKASLEDLFLSLVEEEGAQQ